jgi:hypothetical protein
MDSLLGLDDHLVCPFLSPGASLALTSETSDSFLSATVTMMSSLLISINYMLKKGGLSAIVRARYFARNKNRGGLGKTT